MSRAETSSTPPALSHPSSHRASLSTWPPQSYSTCEGCGDQNESALSVRSKRTLWLDKSSFADTMGSEGHRELNVSVSAPV